MFRFSNILTSILVWMFNIFLKNLLPVYFSDLSLLADLLGIRVISCQIDHSLTWMSGIFFLNKI